MADSNVTVRTSLTPVDGTVAAGDTRTITLIAGVSRCWTRGPSILQNDSNFTVSGNLVFNLGQKSSISLGGWGSTSTGATISAGGCVTVNGSGEHGEANGVSDTSATGFFNIAGNTVNNGTIILNNTTLYNYNNNGNITGNGTIILNNVYMAEHNSLINPENTSFSNISGQTLVMTNSQVSIGTGKGGVAHNVNIVLNGNNNYLVFREHIDYYNINISGFGQGDVLDLALPGGVDSAAYVIDSGSLQIKSFNANTGEQQFIYVTLGKGYDPSLFKTVLIPGTDNQYGIQYVGPTPCYLPGTKIHTGAGLRAVEDIAVGETIVVLEDGCKVLRPVIWVGSRDVRVVDGNSYPVVIRANAFAPNSPDEDLRVTEEHCFFIHDRFVPARMLVNGQSIAYDTSLETYRIHHIELEKHGVILANNALSESFLNTANHRMSGSSSGIRSWDADASYPLCTDRAFVEPIHEEFAARAEALGFPKTTRPADTRYEKRGNVALVINDSDIYHPIRVEGSSFVFRVDQTIRSARLQSRTARPDKVIGPFYDDRRALGLLVGSISLFASQQAYRCVTHLSQTDLRGWSALEAPNARWTLGDALIPDLSTENDSNVIAVEVFDTDLYRVSKEGVTRPL